VSAAELRAVDDLAGARGLQRSAAVRALLRAGLAVEGESVGLPALEDWQVIAARLERLAPERWAGPPDNVAEPT
jgi:hypothetical protein